MKRIFTIIISSFFFLIGFAQMYVWQNSTLVGDYAVGEVDSVKFHKPQLTTDTLRYEPTQGGINAQFSVSETTIVFFSQGNLRYKPSTKEWAFASTQTSRVGEDNASISASYDGWIDLFGWGTSGYNDVMPYLSAQDYTKYANLEDIAGTNYDWGVYNKISNGGNEVGLWRTLTADEWMYLFFSRPNADSLFAFAIVNNVKGLILLPDNWQQPEGLDFYPSTTRGLWPEGKYFWNMASDNYEHNTYSKDQWAMMEAAGAVFLPAAGYRKGTEVEEFNEYGTYWTASGRDDNFAYRCIFYSSILTPGGSNITYYYGYSVRLVQDAIKTVQPEGEMHVFKSNAETDRYFVNRIDSITYRK
jgi:hypothetical protein